MRCTCTQVNFNSTTTTSYYTPYTLRKRIQIYYAYIDSLPDRFSPSPVQIGVLLGRVVKMTGVDEILNYQRDPEDDFYGLLGCDENSTVEQINTEYKVLALQYHPDKNDGDKDAEAKFQKLKEAKETLCDPSKRALYDKWRKSGISMGYKQWLGMKEHIQQSMHWSKPNTKDRMLEESGRSSGPSSLGPSNAAARRASEGGAALWGRWGGGNQEPPSEVISKFRNYEI